MTATWEKRSDGYWYGTMDGTYIGLVGEIAPGEWTGVRRGEPMGRYDSVERAKRYLESIAMSKLVKYKREDLEPGEADAEKPRSTEGRKEEKT